MKLKFLFLSLLMVSGFIFSQEKNEKDVASLIPVVNPQSGKVENNFYTCFKFDWKIEIPENYEITVVTQNPSYLIGFRMDPRNTFTSSLESLTGSSITTLAEHKKFIIQLMNDTYSKIETLKFELSSSDMKIGKYDFYKVQTKLYDPKTNELLLTQDLYNCFINSSLFSVNINYNNPVIGKLLTDNLVKSLSN